jgi:hypothetical protein
MMPNFLVIGAAKSGTTALYNYLNEHPDVYMSPVKETNFFVLEGRSVDFQGPGDHEYVNIPSVNTLPAYQQQFSGVRNEIAIGEVSPHYLSVPRAPARIQHYLPGVRLIAILRNPIERAFSSYVMFLRDGREPCRNFLEAAAKEDARMASNWEWGWRYTKAGFYAAQIERYQRFFSASQLRIYLYDDLKADPGRLMADIFSFLGVDPSFVPNMAKRYNISGVPRRRWLHNVLMRPSPLSRAVMPFIPTAARKALSARLHRANMQRVQMDQGTREYLRSLYRSDILRLQTLIGRDLSAWLDTPQASTAPAATKQGYSVEQS